MISCEFRGISQTQCFCCGGFSENAVKFHRICRDNDEPTSRVMMNILGSSRGKRESEFELFEVYIFTEVVRFFEEKCKNGCCDPDCEKYEAALDVLQFECRYVLDSIEFHL